MDGLLEVVAKGPISKQWRKKGCGFEWMWLGPCPFDDNGAVSDLVVLNDDAHHHDLIPLIRIAFDGSCEQLQIESK